MGRKSEPLVSATPRLIRVLRAGDRLRYEALGALELADSTTQQTLWSLFSPSLLLVAGRYPPPAPLAAQLLAPGWALLFVSTNRESVLARFTLARCTASRRSPRHSFDAALVRSWLGA